MTEERTPLPPSRLPKVGTTIFTVMSALAAERGAVNLGQGFPDFEGDPALLDAVREQGLLEEAFRPIPRTRGVVRARPLSEVSPAARRVTVLHAEQNLAFATRVASRAVILETGRIVWEGTMTALAKDPAARARHLQV